MTIQHFDTLLNKYAQLIVNTGINVRKGQNVVIYAEISQQALVHELIDAAYTSGANRVDVEWSDLHTKREFLRHASEADLQNLPSSAAMRAQEIADNLTSRIAVISNDPDGFSNVDGDRVSTFEQAYQRAVAPVRQATMNNDLDWCVVGAAGQAWAEKIFPNLTPAEAQDELWTQIFKINRVSVDNNPTEEWEAHIATLNTKASWLTDHNFTALHFKSAVTDLTVGLATDHVWEAADSTDKAGERFVANMPTEEVFTSPDFRNISGTVMSTKPLSYAGVLINDIKLTFAEGKVIEASSSTGEEVLKQLLATDAGAKSLGEVSLVPFHSPISESGIVFYNTLFDENASCHLAFGAAYPSNIKNGTTMDTEARQAKGQNDSAVHVDFMVGSSDMQVDGILADGSTVPVFRDGDWA
ncbi:aminopeptidase [Weissella tructae]|uniref:Leucyl aminopeptidase (Aminopeptidase T) n=2 Tax=Weissella TaxID=46255 RepID=A0A075U0J8_9LACO|nr:MULTISPECIES: aminopeptidase [Weissella]AIG65723.1 Leucyl aminopeptidase (Aminopeptidase T) [Weissella tructae]AIM63039.1 Leucyl aminopeptidase (Aminopeptidase T) [Weissella ceti]AIM64438.1 Leucyl aminopeptidase (Aminopeptidase T) [Weissella ceti]ELA06824.1 aminopeptidase S [Weissella ceti NC36]QVV90889.1 aminopeptidase [Weissella tructae]